MEVLREFANFMTTGFGLDLNSKLGASVSFFIEDTIKIFALIYIMLFVISLFRKQLAPEKIRSYLRGKSSWFGYILAVFLGVVTPFCSCSSIPLFIAFLAVGIPFGITMAFLISSPLISEVATALLLITPNAGVKAALTYIFVGGIISVLGGYLCDKFHLKHLRIKKVTDEDCQNCDGQNCHGRHSHKKENEHSCSCGCHHEHEEEHCDCGHHHEHEEEHSCSCGCHHEHEEIEHVDCGCGHHHHHHHTHEIKNQSTVEYAFSYANDTVREIWVYVLVGLAVGALMHGYVPEDMFIKYLGPDNPFAVPIAAIAGIPIYANHDSVLPIVQVLLMKGVPLGTTLVMLMSITAISLPELIMLHKVLSWRMLGLFVSYLFVSFIIVGYIMNFVL